MKELLGWSLDGALDPWSCFEDIQIGSPSPSLNISSLRHPKNVAINQDIHKWFPPPIIPTATP